MTKGPRKQKSKKTGLLPPEETPEATPQPDAGVWGRFKRNMGQQVGKLPNPVALSPVDADLVNEKTELSRVNSLIKKITWQAVILAGLAVALAFVTPFVSPLYIYRTITPEGRVTQMTPLTLPNLTNPAIVKWAATSVTEVLSYGFGDIEAKTLAQKQRFTQNGWAAFVKAFFETGVGESFKKNQMVMTTVPTDTPVILAQGVNEDGVYEWKLDVPIVTTYAANNNVTHPDHGSIMMTIIRVPSDINAAGIAIEVWKQKKS